MLPETHYEGVGETMGTLPLEPPSPLPPPPSGGGVGGGDGGLPGITPMCPLRARSFHRKVLIGENKANYTELL